jgi:cobalt-zinc-cadmium efflux system outer membrane protein
MFYLLGRWLMPSPLLAILLAWALVPSSSIAQSATASPSLGDLYQLAWQRHPAFAAQSARQSQFAASSALAQSVIAGAPTASLGHRNDAVSSPGTRSGLREWEMGVSTPLAIGARRRFAIETATQQAEVYTADVQRAQWLLAGEVRAAYWTWQLSHIEHLLLNDDLRRAEVLVADSQRRTKAGETPRVDTLQAQSALNLVRINLAESLQKEAEALAALQRLTGTETLSKISESTLSAYQIEAQKLDQVTSHPWLSSLVSQLTLSKTKLQTLLQVKGDAPALGTGFSRETSNTSAAQTTARVTLSFALGTQTRFAPRIAEASAEAIENEVVLMRATDQLSQELLVAKTALENARKKMFAARERAATSTETAELFAKAFSLGELEMPVRLRAEAERAAAVLAMNRAVIEHASAISKLNQILGYLP